MATEKTKLELFKEVVGNKLADIKQLFDIPAPVAEFVDVKTSDGAVLRIDGKAPIVGAKCMVVDAAGANPAPDASYTLEDGSVVEVKGGMIAGIEAGASDTAEGATQTPAKMDEEMNQVKESIKSITYKYSEIEKKLAEQSDVNKSAFEKIAKENDLLKSQNKAMYELIEQIAELPADEPTQEPKHTGKQSRFSEFRESVKDMKAQRRKLRD